VIAEFDLQAKTAFPSLGSPITHVDVTYDGKWVLATTDTYLILICTSFKDKDGKLKTGFSGRMGGQVFAPRLLKLLPVDANRDGKRQKLHGGNFSWVSYEFIRGPAFSDCRIYPWAACTSFFSIYDIFYGTTYLVLTLLSIRVWLQRFQSLIPFR
jgi:hypothetical protein